MRAAITADVEGALRDWINSLVGDLVGVDTPLMLGAHLRRLRSPARGCYALLSRVGGTGDWNDNADRARISAGVYGPTKESALLAAIAYANRLRTIGTVQPVVGNVRLRVVDNMTGPTYVPDIDEERYLIDADIYVLPVD